MSKLMKCKTCNAEISKKANACPHCGHTYVRTFYQNYRRNQWAASGSCLLACTTDRRLHECSARTVT
jgi:hypothetical protein